MTNTTEAERPRRRRKEARPSEIVAAAMEVFAEKGFGAARLEEVARRAGVAKGTVFVYFPTKRDLFQAVAETIVSTSFDRAASVAADLDRSIGELIPLLLAQAATVGEGPMGSVVRLLIAEARAFPDLAQIWHDEVVAKMLALMTSAIERAQARGEVRAGDPQLYAFSILGPMLAGVVFRDIFRETRHDLPDLQALARQHTEVILNGVLCARYPAEPEHRPL